MCFGSKLILKAPGEEASDRHRAALVGVLSADGMALDSGSLGEAPSTALDGTCRTLSLLARDQKANA